MPLLKDSGSRSHHHHEVGGSGQVEVEVEMGELVEMADKTMLLKYVVKTQR